MISARGLGKRFGYRWALKEMNLEVKRGEIVALLGPNGAGKTTLLRILATLAKPTLGKCSVAGFRLPQQAADARARLAFLAHQPMLYEELSAEQNLMLTAHLYKIPRPKKRVDELLNAFDLHLRRHEPVRNFSRGMQQRLALARVLLHRPKVLLLDEPHSGLDAAANEQTDRLLKKLAKQGTAILFATHDLHRAKALARRIYTLADGKLKASSPRGSGMAGSYRALRQIQKRHKPVAFLATVLAILRKDLAVEWRARQLLAAMLIFTLLMILIFNFALELDARIRSDVSAGVLWATFAFAGTLGLNRSMAIEKENRALDNLLLAPVDRSAIYFGKALSNLFFMLVIIAFTLPIYNVLYNTNLFSPGFLLVVLLGSWGYSAIGTMLAAMAMQARSRELLLPVLLFPLLIPVLVAAVRASSFFLEGQELSYIWPSLNLLIVIDLIMPALGYMFFDFIVEE